MTDTAQVAKVQGAAGNRVEAPPAATLREYIESLLVTVILALFGTTFIVQAFKIPSQSMEPTLLMGDNRDHSWDSRFWGFVDRDAIMGRPVVIYWSVQSARDEDADRSLNGWLLNFLDTLIHLPSRTRWPRMLHEVH